MDDTPNLNLPYILAAQAQKHVTHNEAIRVLDALVQLAVADKDLAAPPASPANGVRYIVGAVPTGAWAGKALQIAAFQDGAWAFYAPREGFLAWVSDEDELYVWTGAGWIAASSGAGGGGGGVSLNPTPLIGVNTTTAAPNRFAVKSDAVLLSHDDVTPGTGDMQAKINKVSAAKTASLLFQTNFSGRAEFGLAGDDDFHVKVSANGATWKEAIVIDRATGVVSLPFNPAHTQQVVFAGSGTWSKPAGLKGIKVTVTGGGGGGGGCSGVASNAAAAGGGGAGGTSIKWVPAEDLGTSETVTVGAGGSGGADSGGSGGAGGTSSFGSHCSATGGSGGFGMAAGVSAASVNGNVPGAGSGGHLNLSGGGGNASTRLSGAIAVSGSGGDSYWGGGGRTAAGSAPGHGGVAPGAGSGGACTNSATARAGGNGASGLVLVEEFY